MSPHLVTLEHSASPARARILVGFGFNCFDLSLADGDRVVPVLWAHPDFASGQQRPSGSGIPILCPFPGRIPGGVFSWAGKEYRLPDSDGRGNAIHGFVHHRPWRLIRQTATEATAEFQASVDDPKLLEQWPADFKISASYSLEAKIFRMRYRIENPDSRPLPCGFGTHPYFRLPLDSGSPDDCLIRLPVTKQWELVELLPTGRQVNLPADLPSDRPRPFAGFQADNAFTGLVRHQGWSVATLDDPLARLCLHISFDDAFRECVVYTPPHREAICIEPLTCVPGAIQLEPRGIDAGLRVLGPGESFEAEVRFELVAT